jgi:hypothetical protein
VRGTLASFGCLRCRGARREPAASRYFAAVVTRRIRTDGSVDPCTSKRLTIAPRVSSKKLGNGNRRPDCSSGPVERARELCHQAAAAAVARRASSMPAAGSGKCEFARAHQQRLLRQLHDRAQPRSDKKSMTRDAGPSRDWLKVKNPDSPVDGETRRGSLVIKLLDRLARLGSTSPPKLYDRRRDLASESAAGPRIRSSTVNAMVGSNHTCFCVFGRPDRTLSWH